MRIGCTCIAMGLVMIVSGCQDKNAVAPPAQNASNDYAMESDYYIPAKVDSSTSSTTSTDTAEDTIYLTSTSDSGYDGYEPTSNGRKHTVAKGDTLFRLARVYYSDASKWRDIYDANRAVLSDPNKLRVGDRLVIP